MALIEMRVTLWDFIDRLEINVVNLLNHDTDYFPSLNFLTEILRSTTSAAESAKYSQELQQTGER